MLNKSFLKLRLKKLNIPNIPVEERLDLPYDEEKYLIKNFKNMTDEEIILFIKENYLKGKLIYQAFLSKENLNFLMNKLSVNKQYKITHILPDDINDYIKEFSKYNSKRYKKIVMSDPKHESKIFVFIHYKTFSEADLYIGRDYFATDQFE